MIREYHHRKVSFCMSYEVEVLHQRSDTGEFRAICRYTFWSTATSEKSLKDIVRRDMLRKGLRPDRIVIKNRHADIRYIINCRKQ